MSNATFADVARIASLVTVIYGALAWGAVAFGANPIQGFAAAVGGIVALAVIFWAR